MTSVMLAKLSGIVSQAERLLRAFPSGQRANVRDALESMRSAPLRTPASMGRCGTRRVPHIQALGRRFRSGMARWIRQ